MLQGIWAYDRLLIVRVGRIVSGGGTATVRTFFLLKTRWQGVSTKMGIYYIIKE